MPLVPVTLIGSSSRQEHEASGDPLDVYQATAEAPASAEPFAFNYSCKDSLCLAPQGRTSARLVPTGEARNVTIDLLESTEPLFSKSFNLLEPGGAFWSDYSSSFHEHSHLNRGGRRGSFMTQGKIKRADGISSKPPGWRPQYLRNKWKYRSGFGSEPVGFRHSFSVLFFDSYKAVGFGSAHKNSYSAR